MPKAIALGLGKLGVAASFGPPLGVRANFSELGLGRTPAGIISIPEGLLDIELNAVFNW
jgi:hypothetical protein